MGRFLLTRLGLALVTLVLVSIIVFSVAEILPGDVGRTILGPYASNEQVDRLNHELGNDRPLPVRYADWVSGFVTGDWGDSVLLNTPVRTLVLDRLGNSLVLGLFALVLIVPFSIALGVVAALHHGEWPLAHRPPRVRGRGDPPCRLRREARLVPCLLARSLAEPGGRLQA